MEFYYIPSVPMSVHYVFAIIFLLIVTSTITGNGLAIFVFLRNRKLFVPYSVFVFALCLCDFFVGLTGSSLVAVTSFTGGWIYGDVGCMFHGTMMTFLGLYQISVLTALAVYRWATVVTLNLKKKLTTLVCAGMVGICGLFSLAVSLAPAVYGWSSFELEPLRTSCAPNWHGTSDADISYSITLFVVCFVLPLMIIGVAYCMILKKVFFTKHPPLSRNHRHMEKRVTKTSLLMIGTFLISWTPYSCLSLYVVATGDGEINPVLGTVPAIIAKMSTVWNPIIYISLNKSFKDAWIKTFPFCTKFCGRRVNPTVATPEVRDNEMRPRGPLAEDMNNICVLNNQNKCNGNPVELINGVHKIRGAAQVKIDEKSKVKDTT